MPRKSATSKLEPEVVEMPSQKMAVVKTVGDPNVVAEQAFPALFGSVYALKFALKKKGIDFKVRPPRARWPNAHLVPKDQWVGLWGLPVPEDTTALPKKKDQAVSVHVERWDYGMVAQVLHIGPYAEEWPTVQRLHAFIMDKGYEIAGVHEEEYLTTPRAKVQKTIIRYPVKKR